MESGYVPVGVSARKMKCGKKVQTLFHQLKATTPADLVIRETQPIDDLSLA